MSQKVRIQLKVRGWYFPEYPGLVWHSGKFWLNEMPAKMRENNGSKAVMYYTTKLGVIKLRKQAVECSIEIFDKLPF